MIKTFLFDIDNTLYDYDAAHQAAFRAVSAYACRAYGLTPDAFIALHKRGNQLLQERVGSVTAAIHNRLIRYQIMLEELGRHMGGAPRMAELYWSTFLDAMEPGAGLADCMAALKEQGFRLGVAGGCFRLVVLGLDARLFCFLMFLNVTGVCVLNRFIIYGCV